MDMMLFDSAGGIKQKATCKEGMWPDATADSGVHVSLSKLACVTTTKKAIKWRDAIPALCVWKECQAAFCCVWYVSCIASTRSIYVFVVDPLYIVGYRSACTFITQQALFFLCWLTHQASSSSSSSSSIQTPPLIHHAHTHIHTHTHSYPSFCDTDVARRPFISCPLFFVLRGPCVCVLRLPFQGWWSCL